MLLLSPCSVKRESDGDELSFVRYMECVASLDAGDEALKCVCLQCATSGSGKEENGVGKEELERADGDREVARSDSIPEYCKYLANCLSNLCGASLYGKAAL